MPAPIVGNQLPRRGNRFTRWLGSALLAVFGWRIEGSVPNLPKLVGIVAPLTSNWDFFFGICAAFALGVRVGWVGKHTLFRWPFGVLMRWLGGVPVDRVSTEGRVEQIDLCRAGEEVFALMAGAGLDAELIAVAIWFPIEAFWSQRAWSTASNTAWRSCSRVASNMASRYSAAVIARPISSK